MGLFSKSKKPDIEKMKKNQDVEGLIRAIEDDDIDVRNSAIKALDRMNDNPRVVAALIAALNDGNWLVRFSASAILGGSHDPRAVEALIPTLKDKDEAVRYAAVRALKTAAKAIPGGDPRIEQAVSAAVLAETDPNWKQEMLLLQ